MIRIAAHLVHLGLIPFAVVRLPDEIQNLRGLEHGERKLVGVGGGNQRFEPVIDLGFLEQQFATFAPVVSGFHAPDLLDVGGVAR